MDTPLIIAILVYAASSYICRGYIKLMDYSFELMIYCFIADEEMFQGTQRFADPKLRAFFDTFGQEVKILTLSFLGWKKRI